MKYCVHCGTQLPDNAAFCSGCGIAVNPTPVAPAPAAANTASYSDNYPSIRAFCSRANTIRVFGILAAALCFGVGIVFSIIIWAKTSNIIVPNPTNATPRELAELQEAKRKLDIGRRLAGIPLIAIGLCILVGLFAGVFAAL